MTSPAPGVDFGPVLEIDESGEARRRPVTTSQATDTEEHAMSYRSALEEPAWSNRPQAANSLSFRFSSVLGTDAVLRACLNRAKELVDADPGAILIVGEPGTGKELLARAIHAEGSRSSKPFVTLDCRAMDAKLLEAELFGYEPGGLPELLGGRQGLMETADGGTLLLRRIDELPLMVQPRLLSALQSKTARRIGAIEGFPVRCRVVASASPRIFQAIEDGLVRQDLYRHFEEARLTLPPLREREGDVTGLANQFLNQIATLEGLQCREFSDAACSALEERRWPGNVRELRRMIQQTARSATGQVVEVFDLPFYQSRNGAGPADAGSAAILIPPTGRSLDEIEAEAISLTLDLTGHNKSATARILGISRPTLSRKIRKYGLVRAEARSN
jgi:DNA-binding NtrC family response regulator